MQEIEINQNSRAWEDKLVLPPVRVIPVNVPTTTAILFRAGDPYTVLVGSSVKHPYPVLPGGKIDGGDLVATSLLDAAKRCVMREVCEEVNAIFRGPRLVDVRYARGVDTRTVSSATLRATVAAPDLPALTADTAGDSTVTAAYGLPDFVFAGEVDADRVCDSEELFNLTWIDLRASSLPQLSCGHTAVLARYRAELIEG